MAISSIQLIYYINNNHMRLNAGKFTNKLENYYTEEERMGKKYY